MVCLVECCGIWIDEIKNLWFIQSNEFTIRNSFMVRDHSKVITPNKNEDIDGLKIVDSTYLKLVKN